MSVLLVLLYHFLMSLSFRVTEAEISVRMINLNYPEENFLALNPSFRCLIIMHLLNLIIQSFLWRLYYTPKVT